jgi:hypothetical protein
MITDGMVSPADLDVFLVTDDPKEAAGLVEGFYKQHESIINF